jgi:transcriptional regulator GlxA family with amidase domain
MRLMAEDGANDSTFNIGIFVYDRAEELDFCGPLEVLSNAAELEAGKRKPAPGPWQVFTVGEKADILQMSGGLLVQPQYTFAQHPRIDLLLVPGGWTVPQVENPLVVEWVRAVAAGAQIATSVCTGVFLLGAVGLLDDRDVTTHASALEWLATDYPAARVQRGVRWVDQGSLVTAAGISAGIDMSLHLVERLLSRETAEQVARYMEYNWQET